MNSIDMKADLWHVSDETETLKSETIAEAVEDWADDWYPNPLPEKITVHGYKRMELPSVDRIADGVLVHILEWFDDEHGGPDATDPDEGMVEAAKEFASYMRKYYHVWACEKCTEVEVTVSDYYQLPQNAEEQL